MKMRKKLIPLLLGLAALCAVATPVRAQGWEVAGAVAAPVIQKGLEEIAAGIFSWFNDHCCPVRICGGRVWWVVYADGTVVSNEFRLCRDYDDIYNHVLYGNGDCDWRDNYGRTACYDSPGRARGMIQAHGQIVDIQHQ